MRQSIRILCILTLACLIHPSLSFSAEFSHDTLMTRRTGLQTAVSAARLSVDDHASYDAGIALNEKLSEIARTLRILSELSSAGASDSQERRNFKAAVVAMERSLAKPQMVSTRMTSLGDPTVENAVVISLLHDLFVIRHRGAIVDRLHFGLNDAPVDYELVGPLLDDVDAMISEYIGFIENIVPWESLYAHEILKSFKTLTDLKNEYVNRSAVSDESLGTPDFSYTGYEEEILIQAYDEMLNYMRQIVNRRPSDGSLFSLKKLNRLIDEIDELTTQMDYVKSLSKFPSSQPNEMTQHSFTQQKNLWESTRNFFRSVRDEVEQNMPVAARLGEDVELKFLGLEEFMDRLFEERLLSQRQIAIVKYVHGHGLEKSLEYIYDDQSTGEKILIPNEGVEDEYADAVLIIFQNQGPRSGYALRLGATGLGKIQSMIQENRYIRQKRRLDKVRKWMPSIHGARMTLNKRQLAILGSNDLEVYFVKSLPGMHGSGAALWPQKVQVQNPGLAQVSV